MSLYGYARVSTTDQDLGVQEDALRAAGCQVVRFEKVTGTTREGHTQLATLLELVRAGDTLAVTRLDRLARAIGDLQDVVRTLKVKGAALKAIKQPIVTSTAAGKAFLDMLGVFAGFETNLRREHQMKGIAAAKARAASPTRCSTTSPDAAPSSTCCRRLPHRTCSPWPTVQSSRAGYPRRVRRPRWRRATAVARIRWRSRGLCACPGWSRSPRRPHKLTCMRTVRPPTWSSPLRTSPPSTPSSRRRGGRCVWRCSEGA